MNQKELSLHLTASCQASCSFDPAMQLVLRARNIRISLQLAVEIRAEALFKRVAAIRTLLVRSPCGGSELLK